MSDDIQPKKSDVDLSKIDKYVRTFDRDMAEVQRGVHPDLTPMDTPHLPKDVPKPQPPPAPPPIPIKKPDVDLSKVDKYVRTFSHDITEVEHGGHPDLTPFGTTSVPKSVEKPTPPVPTLAPKAEIKEQPKKESVSPPPPKPTHLPQKVSPPSILITPPLHPPPAPVPTSSLPPPPAPVALLKAPLSPPPKPTPPLPAPAPVAAPQPVQKPEPAVVPPPPEIKSPRPIAASAPAPVVQTASSTVPNTTPPPVSPTPLRPVHMNFSSMGPTTLTQSVDALFKTNTNIDPSTVVPVFRTYASDLAALQAQQPGTQAENQKPIVPDTPKPVPASVPPTPRPVPPREEVPLPSFRPTQPLPPQRVVIREDIVVPDETPTPMPLGHVETREDVLARLRAKVAAARGKNEAPLISQKIPTVFLEEQRRREEGIRERDKSAALAAMRTAEREIAPPQSVYREPLPDAEEVESMRATDRLVGGSPLEPTASAFRFRRPAPPPPVRAPELEPTPIHTYVSDFSDHLQTTRASTATVLAAEADAGGVTEVPDAERRSRMRNIAFVVAGFIFIIGSVTSAYIVNTFYTQHPATVAPAPTIVTPIFVDDRMQLSGAGAELRAGIEQAVAAPLSTNSVRLLYTGAGTTTVTNLFSLLQLPAPGALLRNIQNAKSITGLINTGDTQSPFFILSVTSYKDTFAGMLAWEPRMVSDLTGFFPPYPEFATTQPVTISTTTVQKPTPPPSFLLLGFRDEIIANHDTRVYRDAAGKSILLYGYWTPTTLIIARDEASFTELISRLGSSRTQQ